VPHRVDTQMLKTRTVSRLIIARGITTVMYVKELDLHLACHSQCDLGQLLTAPGLVGRLGNRGLELVERPQPKRSSQNATAAETSSTTKQTCCGLNCAEEPRRSLASDGIGTAVDRQRLSGDPQEAASEER
jgi:hypothetical protein